MTDERNELVSQTYREVADERAPERLNEAVLKEARRAARPKYARSRAWTRPLAWAATIVLTVAVVVEVTQTPVPGGSSFDVAAPETEGRLESAPAVLEEAAREAQVPAAAEPEKAKGDERKREADAVADSPAEPSATPASAVTFKLQDKDLLRRADELAEQQYADDMEVQGLAQGSNVAGCPTAVTDDPEDWLACVEALEKEGLLEIATEERRRLQEAFPDFELP